ncbi:ATP-dependent helicase [Pseudorhizobium halotolerans]|uniref:ATP-dependent helicase n=1 Tax=Pseudorhizobium halotolerans TaxID=1233081 RepID=A0ABN7JWC5_9HYPH|nr:hypothetical protein [Pseudorhizobium halotolerans]CAD7050725.1 ATP-dependent helicase [Pseudorhizobium halotolerans]
MVMVAYPAAAGDAAQYLQSEDRIHRLGLPPGQDTTIEIVECNGSVDEIVRQRLEFKVGQMAAALNDSGLTISPVPIVPDETDEGLGAGGLDEGDVRALLAALGG